MTDSAAPGWGRMPAGHTRRARHAQALLGALCESRRSVAVFVAVAAFQLVLVTTHVHWRDELQALSSRRSRARSPTSSPTCAMKATLRFDTWCSGQRRCSSDPRRR